MENIVPLEKVSTLECLLQARNMNSVAKLTTHELEYRVIDFREYNEDNVEVQLTDESMRVIPYNTIIDVRSHSKFPHFPQID